MKSTLLPAVLCLVLFCSCRKEIQVLNLSTPASGFTKFIIRQGEHYTDENVFKLIETSQLKFTVMFDSSAIYQTTAAENQYDINKLWGFADNGSQHQLYSARMGWRWSDGALRLFAYTYNNGERNSKELSVVAIGQEIYCSIQVINDSYVFTVNESTLTMPRLSTTPLAKGYQLYPYFGGDETAPHEVRIWIKE